MRYCGENGHYFLFICLFFPKRESFGECNGTVRVPRELILFGTEIANMKSHLRRRKGNRKESWI